MNHTRLPKEVLLPDWVRRDKPGNLQLKFTLILKTWCTKFYNEFISCFYMFRAHVLNARRPKLYYTGTGRPPIGVMIPEAV